MLGIAKHAKEKAEDGSKPNERIFKNYTISSVLNVTQRVVFPHCGNSFRSNRNKSEGTNKREEIQRDVKGRSL
ncbi:hypothetical protein POVCU2_0035830 [Plasmodium ovale curtisi]|uniref:Uncharacterized protein n=1 Tax=Plasmodium ovale curtisi TaxID=864141 RepID=A0A1A8W3G7_PLAOA|nr:hypothetical protein POVCU2_0035830 [Plasmodium ovale curtisi]